MLLADDVIQRGRTQPVRQWCISARRFIGMGRGRQFIWEKVTHRRQDRRGMKNLQRLLQTLV